MRYFLTGRQPEPSAILLVESGSRGPLEGVAAGLRGGWGADVPIDLFTCYPGVPRGFETEGARIYRSSDYRTADSRRRVRNELAARGYTHLGIVCSGEPVLTKWKWGLAASLPAKIFVINENGDYFWLDWKHLSIIYRFVMLRSGLAGTGAVRTLARVAAFPFSLAYLILYAGMVHGRRALRRLG